MKKFISSFFASALLAGSLSALQIDADAARVDFVAYKAPNKARVPEMPNSTGTFKDAKFNFAKTSGSVAEILKDAMVEFSLNSIDTIKNPARDNNIKTKFFSLLNSQKVSGKITSVSGDDASGTANALINLNSVEKEVVLKYQVKEGKLVAVGEVDLTMDFNTKDAFEKFANDKIIQGLHAKKTWPNVTVGFWVPVK